MDLIPEAGDLVLAHSKDTFGKLIRFAQWLRPSWRPYKYWNHSALVVSNINGEITCVQMGRRCVTVTLENVAPGGVTQIRKCPEGVDRVKALDYALRQVGVRYSYLTIVSIALNLLTPKAFRINFRRNGTALICSALCARSYEHGDWIIPDNSDPFQVTPCQLAMWVK